MTTPLEVTGELGNLCAARQAELEAARKKKNDREAEIKRLQAVNAELLYAAKQVWRRHQTFSVSTNESDYVDAYSPFGLAMLGLRYAIEKAEGS